MKAARPTRTENATPPTGGYRASPDREIRMRPCALTPPASSLTLHLSEGWLFFSYGTPAKYLYNVRMYIFTSAIFVRCPSHPRCPRALPVASSVRAEKRSPFHPWSAERDTGKIHSLLTNTSKIPCLNPLTPRMSQKYQKETVINGGTPRKSKG